MSQNHIQTNFNSGEWAPSLNARVDLSKYHSGAALLRNFFVDYRGGVSNRPGGKYVNTSLGLNGRLIPFQASFLTTYVLVFTSGKLRFISNGASVLEAPITITGATQAFPAHITAANAYASDDWLYIANVVGMTQLNNRYFAAVAPTGAGFDIKDLFGVNINSIGYSPYISGGTAQRVYTIASPYLAADLPLLKYAQNGTQLILTHPNYPPYVLTLISATSWTLAPITFGATIGPPTAGFVTSTTLAAGNVNYAYRVTSVDTNGQESGPSAVQSIVAKEDIQTVAGTNTITWTGIAGAVSYNVYKARERFGAGVPAGAAYGFIGNCTGVTFIDTYPGFAPDFTQSMPIEQNPFTGSGVSSLTLTNAGGGYGSVPVVSFTGGGGTGTTAHVTMIATGSALVSGGFGPIAPYAPGDQLVFVNAIVLTALVVINGQIITYAITSFGNQTTTIPANPVAQVATTGAGLGASFNFTYSVASLILDAAGTSYGGAPTVVFTPASGGVAATATVGTAAAGNPSVPAFSQQRLMLAAPPLAVNTVYGSQPGAPFNFNVSDPRLPDDALQATIVSNKLNVIKSMLGMPAGLIVFTDQLVFQVNGGGPSTPFTAVDIFANPQSYVGANDIAPLVANQEILFVQAKGSVVRNLSYNFYANVWTGTDVSVLSSHLFYGYQLLDWCWAEEPFKTAWAVRSDGNLLSLCFLKEQELIGWAHHDTPNGLYKSICSVTETVNGNNVDAVYVIVQRIINGFTVQYIERFADRYPTNYVNGWFVDSGLQYTGTPATVISGLEHLIGQTVTGLADGNVIPPTVVSAGGSITLAQSASTVTVGLGFVSQLQTLALDIGNPTIQGKRKSISAVTVKVSGTLGMKLGGTFNDLVTMKDLILGNLNVPGNYTVTDLVTGDARTVTAPSWTEPGQYCIQQDQPYPATILGVVPEIEVGDDAKQ